MRRSARLIAKNIKDNTRAFSGLSPNVPLNVINNIIGVLAEEGLMGDVKTFSQVSSFCNRLARKHIFKNIYIDSSSDKRRNLRQFISLIEANRGIAPLIRTLRIFSSDNDTNGVDEDSELQSRLYKSMSSLHNLQVLGLCGIDSGSWGLLHRLIMSASPKHIHVELWCFENIPVGDLALATHPRSFDLNNVSFEMVPHSRLDANVGHCWENLEKLRLEIPGVDMRFFLPHQNNIPPSISLGGLKTLEICFLKPEGPQEELKSRMVSAISSLMAVFKVHHMSSLESLTLDLDSWAQCPIGDTEWVDIYDNLISSCKATLKHFKTSTIVTDSQGDPYSGLIPVLESLRHQNVLETLTLMISVRHKEQPVMFTDAWQSLTLLAEDGWQYLCKVKVYIEVTVSNDEESRQVIQDLDLVRNTHLRPLVDTRQFAFELNVTTNQIKVSISGTPKRIQCYTTDAVQHDDSTKLPPVLTINDLPPEILSEIFRTYMFWEDESDLINPEVEGLISVIEPSSRSAPLLFCQVCSYWREVAISTPSLWSSIALKNTLQLDTVNLWLQRGRNHPLSFAVWLSSPYSHLPESPDKWTRWPELLKLLCREIHRWQDVLIYVPSIASTQLFMDALLPSKGKSPASMLRTLDVSNGSHVEQMNAETVDRLSSFPHDTLRLLAWGGDIVPNFQQVDRRMWENLQQLTFTHIQDISLFEFLEACPNIISIHIHSLFVLSHINSHITAVTAPKLQALHIHTVGGDVTEVLRRVIAPCLKFLSFRQLGKGYAGATDRLVAFLYQSQCRLTSLSARIATRLFKEQEARMMLTTKVISQIPSVSLRMPQENCHSLFPGAVVAEASSGYNRSRTYAYHEPLNGGYHMGWGHHDFIRDYVCYPFICKGPVPRAK